ncbi:MAG: shikimate kinase [Bacteroides sp.]|nr:shikimate kinase [Ruminococcus flavefaciens]MCM1555047.1 shikimate kinase [Bacteroides sp.]MCM1555502.1 shikimate kinase [Bacteroides sp.]
MNIYLIGFMGCGKNTLGAELASALNLEISDTDALVQKVSGMSIPEIFDRQGEAAFRQLESDVLRSLPDRRLVITGGGLPCSQANMDHMKENGYAVWLDVPVPVLLERLKNGKDKEQRPLIRRFNDKELENYITKTIEKRKMFYGQAHFTFRPCEQSIDLLIEKLKTIKL